jgi:hypothetical protein
MDDLNLITIAIIIFGDLVLFWSFLGFVSIRSSEDEKRKLTLTASSG